jgi:arylsulfatase A
MKPTRRQFLSQTAAACGLSVAGAAQAQSRPPNIVLILADDIGFECFGAYGSTQYTTPRIDKLAHSGARFDHAYSQPLCTPSRVEIMTGKHNFRNYIDFGTMDVTQPTFASMLRGAGYKTAIAGKWQLSPADLNGPHSAGFDEYCLWHFEYITEERPDPRFVSKGSRYKSPLLFRNGKEIDGLEDKYGPDVECDFLCQFMRENKDRPFLAYYPMTLVHNPFQPTPRSADWERGGTNARYFPEMISYMDNCVGRIVDQLDALGLRENTLVMFTTDNGTNRGIASTFPGRGTIQGGKSLMTDAGTHAAFIANWTGKIPAGTVVDEPICFADVLPTIAETTGATLPGGVIDGQSLLPLMKGDSSAARGWIFMSYSRDGVNRDPFRCFVRDKRWKLYDDGKLYDIPNDWLEERPASGPAADAARAKLRPLIDQYMQEVEAVNAKGKSA